VRGFLQRPERNKTNLVRLTHFFKCPANAHVTRKSLAAIGRPFKGGNGGGHGQILPQGRMWRVSQKSLAFRGKIAVANILQTVRKLVDVDGRDD